MDDAQKIPTVGKLETKREHYLPRFFLRCFTDMRGKISYVTRVKETNRAALYENMRVENVAVQKALYETPYLGAGSGEYYFPNYLEKSLSSIEKQLSDDFKDVSNIVLNMRPSEQLSNKDLSRIVEYISIFIPHILLRSPDAVRNASVNADVFLNAMKQLNIDSPEALKKIYRDTAMDEEFDDSLVFDPQALAEQSSLLLQVLPNISNNEEAIKASPLYKAVMYFQNCSFLLLTTSVGHPFIGIDRPICTVLDEGFCAWYYPLSSKVAVMLFEDNRHTFEKRSINRKQLKDFNRIAFNDGSWNLVFCERSDYLRQYGVVEEGK